MRILPIFCLEFAIIEKLASPHCGQFVNQDPQHAEFVLGTCPDCSKVVRIPVTAVTAQSTSQVCCPMCEAAFEIGDILDEVIPSVKVIDDEPEKTVPQQQASKQKKRINAIDTPELFHSKEDDYQPTTEKKNGRFVVPELLSKGSKSARKKKKSSRRRRSGNDYDPKLAQSLAKLKENTSNTSLSPDSIDGSNDTTAPTEDRSRERSSSERGMSGRSGKDGRERSSRGEKSRSESGRRSSRENRSRTRKKRVGLMAVRNGAEFKAWLRGKIASLGTGDKLSSKWDLLMVVVGVFLAVPVVHLLLWWFIGVDPFGLARPTSYMIPFVVPAEMRPLEKEEVETESRTVLTDQSVSPLNSSANSSLQMIDGKLPTPKLDPSSVHSDGP